MCVAHLVVKEESTAREALDELSGGAKFADVAANVLERVADAQGVKRRYPDPDDLIADLDQALAASQA